MVAGVFDGVVGVLEDALLFLDRFDHDLDDAGIDHAERPGHAGGNVDDAATNEWAPIVDEAFDGNFSVGYPKLFSEWMTAMGAGHFIFFADPGIERGETGFSIGTCAAEHQQRQGHTPFCDWHSVFCTGRPRAENADWNIEFPTCRCRMSGISAGRPGTILLPAVCRRNDTRRTCDQGPA